MELHRVPVVSDELLLVSCASACMLGRNIHFPSTYCLLASQELLDFEFAPFSADNTIHHHIVILVSHFPIPCNDTIYTSSSSLPYHHFSALWPREPSPRRACRRRHHCRGQLTTKLLQPPYPSGKLHGTSRKLMHALVYSMCHRVVLASLGRKPPPLAGVAPPLPAVLAPVDNTPSVAWTPRVRIQYQIAPERFLPRALLAPVLVPSAQPRRRCGRTR